MKYNHKLAASTAASWDDPEVRKARTTRHNCSVNGIKFRSIHGAIKALGLPTKNQHAFRLHVKKTGRGLITHEGKEFHFKLGDVIS